MPTATCWSNAALGRRSSGRQWTAIDSPRWSIGDLRPEPFSSGWGAPYGDRCVVVPPGRSVAIDLPGSAFSIAYAAPSDAVRPECVRFEGTGPGGYEIVGQ